MEPSDRGRGAEPGRERGRWRRGDHQPAAPQRNCRVSGLVRPCPKFLFQTAAEKAAETSCSGQQAVATVLAVVLALSLLGNAGLYCLARQRGRSGKGRGRRRAGKVMAVQPSSPAVLIPSTSESDLASYHLGSLHSLPDRVLEAEDERYHSVGSGLGSLARGVLDLASSLGSRQRLERRLTADTVILDGGEGDSLGGHRLPGAGGQDGHQGGDAGSREAGGQRGGGFVEIDLEEEAGRRRRFFI